ncbi:ABC transporter permease [Salisediminibacterium halotolerans]|uniref:ABC transporter permease n=1 Tax=Salisediminibacterium halotolerans TaxID=517425 RepID=UPI000EAF1687|nr:iron ABC transporter permease [Salisediminibacterium halotolerans]RLJ75508.1 iron(III) transport system permease protein [Actinophytocola xinjiangensis]RPE89361.1 iron(III) transport system permease protein [Salisediminibacterium halotolerans]TWG36121.1 iron(III) transport system permease protein [Salisediminibacterium halotolerans]GEL08123.1 ABC transporter permease [Salisediminibacterium halotolerans]
MMQFLSERMIHRVNKGAALLALAVLVLFPLLMVLYNGVAPDGEWLGLEAFSVLAEDRYIQIFINSMLLGIGVVIGASILAAPLAYFMARTELRRHRWIDIVLIIPFMTPPYIGAMGWILSMQSGGYAEQLFPFLAGITPYFFTYFGMVLVMSLHLFPFIYLIMRNTLENIGGRLEEAGLIHGGGFFYRLRRIVTPLFFSGYSMGALLVFVKTIGEFGTLVTLGNRIGFYVMTSQIHTYTSIWPLDFGTAAILSTVLLGVSMTVWYIQQWFVSRKHTKVVSGKGQTRAYNPLGKYQVFAWAYLAGVLFLAIGVPYFSVASTAFMDITGDGLALSNLTFSNFIELFAGSGREALFNSLWLAALAATISVALGVWFAILIMKRNRAPEKTMDFLSLAPNTVPGIVVVVGLIFFWNAFWNPIGVYNTWMMLVLTYVILYLPFTVQNIKAIYGQLGDSLFQASRMSGASSFYMLRKILLPLIVPGVLAGWIMTFTISMRELVGSLILRPPNMDTSATFIYSQFEQGSQSLGMAMALVSVGLTTIVLIVVEHYKDKAQSYRAS